VLRFEPMIYGSERECATCYTTALHVLRVFMPCSLFLWVFLVDYRFLSYMTVLDLRSHNVQYYLPLHKWLVASGDSTGQMMVLMPHAGSGLQLVSGVFLHSILIYL